MKKDAAAAIGVTRTSITRADEATGLQWDLYPRKCTGVLHENGNIRSCTLQKSEAISNQPIQHTDNGS